MLSRRNTLKLGAAGALAALAGPAWSQAPSLNDLARAKGLRFGSAVGVGPAGSLTGSFDDPAFRQLLARECGLLVHENELKWYVLRPSEAVYDFDRADRVMAFAAENGQEVRGHTLLWHHPQWFPAWTETHDYGARPATEVERLMTEHIRTVAGRYRGAIRSWDVINEAVDPADASLRETVFSRHMGGAEPVLDLAFHVARDTLPDAQLVYNDYMSWEAGHETHQRGVLKMLEGFKARGVPVDALGVQSHIGSGNADDSEGFDTARETQWRRFLDEVVAMGYDLVITEFDVHDKNLPADIAVRDQAVADLGRRYLDLMLTYPQLSDVVAWGLADRYTWLQNNWPREDGLPKRPTPYDPDFQAKPLRAAIADAFRAAAPRPA